MLSHIEAFYSDTIKNSVKMPSQECHKADAITCSILSQFVWNLDNNKLIERNEYVTIAVESQFKQLRSSPKKSFSGLQRDSNLWPLRSCCSALPVEL